MTDGYDGSKRPRSIGSHNHLCPWHKTIGPTMQAPFFDDLDDIRGGAFHAVRVRGVPGERFEVDDATPCYSSPGRSVRAPDPWLLRTAAIHRIAAL